MGRRPTRGVWGGGRGGQRGGSRPRSGGRQRRTGGVAGGEGIGGFREAGVTENPVGQRTGAPRKAAVGEDDGSGGGGGHDTMVAHRGRKSG
jgi:hypothetical protein